MTQLAQMESPIPLEDRIADLRLAVHSGSLACQQLASGRRSDADFVILEELQKKLEIAGTSLFCTTFLKKQFQNCKKVFFIN